MRVSKLLLASTALLSGLAGAAELSINAGTINAANFKALSEDLGAALSYKPMIPAEPLGITGFDIGVGLTQTKLENASQYAGAVGGDTNLYLPTLRAHKGLPFGIDVGLAYAKAGDIKYTGGELRYAILDGGVAMPALAVRGSMTKVSGVDNFDFSTKAIDLSISKGVLMLKPYAGIGKVWVNSEANVGTTFKEDFTQNKYFVGLGFNMLLLNLNLEADKTGDATSYSAKVGLRF